MLCGFLCFFLGIASLAWAQNDSLSGWHLLWSDEFDGKKIDPMKWQVENAALVKNNELQYYAEDEAYLGKGNLVLRSQEREMGGRAYTSGLVETKGKFSFQYGKVEIRAKLPQGKGIWPALWMLPVTGKWPPEIDIMELLGHQPNVVYMSLYWGEWPDKHQFGKMYIGPDFSQGFHVYSIEWDEQMIRWFIDGELRAEIDHDIPQEQFFIILNTAVGGDWPGRPNSRTKFPQYHYIDYVRVYAKEIPGTYFLTTQADNGQLEISPNKPRYQDKEEVTLKAIAPIGYKFSHFSGSIKTKDNPAKITMNSHRQITAHFIVDKKAPRLISQDKPVFASSSEGGEFIAEKANDGELSTRWSSEFSDPQWIYVDLGKIYNIKAIRLFWEQAFAREYEIQVSDDSRTWQTICSQKKGKGGTEEISGLDVWARYVKVYGMKRAREWGYSLVEFEVFGNK